MPDQRGYNLSDKPESVKAYTLDELAANIVGPVSFEIVCHLVLEICNL